MFGLNFGATSSSGDVGVGYVPYIDNLTAAPFFSFSVYKPSSSITNGVRIREDSGNTELDIPYQANGLINTSAISTFLNGANGYLVTGYNGDASGVDTTESTAASQSPYNASGALSKPCFDFSNSNTRSYPFDSAFSNSGEFHGFFLMQLTDNSGADLALVADSASGAWAYIRYRPKVSNRYTYLGMSQGSGSALYNYGVIQPTGTYLVEVRRDSSNNVEVSLNNGTQFFAGTHIATNAIDELIGTISSGSSFELYDIALWDSELSTADRNVYIAHINNNFGLAL